jgi:hypothetical protein
VHLLVEHKLVGHELHQTRVDEDAGGDGVKDTVDDERLVGARLERLVDAKAGGNGDGSGEAVDDTQDPRHPTLRLWPLGGGQTGAEAEALEGLVEDEYDVEDFELFSGDCESEADEDGMEDDAEFEDEESGHLGGEVLLVVLVSAVVAEVVFTAGGIGEIVYTARDCIASGFLDFIGVR